MTGPRRRPFAWRTHLLGYAFIAPWLAGLLVFTLGPVVAAFGLGFYRWDLFTAARFVGLANFVKLSHDPLFYRSIVVTLYYTALAVPAGIVFALALALMLNARLPGMYLFRTVFFLPNVVAGVAMLLVWRWLFNPDFGLINGVLDLVGLTHLLDLVGIGRPQWLASRGWAVPSLVLIGLWGVGGSMLFFLAGLQSVPEELLEAAELDGAGRCRRFLSVTLPFLTPTIFFLLVVGIIGSLQVFGQAYILTRGGPANSTLFYSLYLFVLAFDMFQMGYACAMALLLFVAVLALTLLQMRLSTKWVFYQ